MELTRLIASIDINQEELVETMTAFLVDTRSACVAPEHVLAALIQVKNGFCRRRIKRQQLEPDNVVEVLKGCMEDTDVKVARIHSVDNAPLDDATMAIAHELEQYLSQTETTKIPEEVLLVSLVSRLSTETIEALVQYAFVNWEELVKGLDWPPEAGRKKIVLWNPDTYNLRTDRVFDKSGRKLLSIFLSESQGLGMREFTIEAFFIALLTIEPSVLDIAIRTQLSVNQCSFNDTRDLVSEMRRRIRRPRNIAGYEEININQCSENLIRVLEKAAQLAEMDSRMRISTRDLAEAFALNEAGGRFEEVLKVFGIDFSIAADFLEGYQDTQDEEEDTLIPYHQLEDRIRQEVVGQDHAVKRILPLIKRLRFGYRRPGKPAGVFLFMGPSGTGKTHMSKVLAQALYGSSESLIMLEMGQFGTKESKSMFIGAPPGYVGYGEGKLTNGLRDKPESVILFDEIEKADPLVFDVLLRFLDEGCIDDPAGPVRDGSRCLIVLTSNFMADSLTRFEKEMTNLDEKAQESVYRELRKELLNQGIMGSDEKIKKFFRPEFVFRIDEIILFRSFNRDDYRKITQMAVNSEIHYIKEHFEYDIVCGDDVVDKIVDECLLRKNEGARVVGRLVNVTVVNPLIDYFAARTGELPGKISLSLDPDIGNIMIGETP